MHIESQRYLKIRNRNAISNDKDMLLYFNDDFNRKKCVKLWGGMNAITAIRQYEAEIFS